MGKKLTAGIVILVLIMIGLPLLTELFVKGEGGFLVIFLMFYVIDPLWSALAGIFAGTDIRRLWSLPVISAILYLAGTWGIFEMGESAFVLMALVYLLTGVVFMGITYFVLRKVNKG